RRRNWRRGFMSNFNVGGIDRVSRVVSGSVSIAMVFVGPKTGWGWIGLVPSSTGSFRVCPLYSSIGPRTMHDIRSIRENPAAFDAALARRGVEPVAQSILALDSARRDVATRMQESQARRNEASKAIGAAMGK
ncbi:hypothetical protein OY671_008761, partial [Metschnikowia pulcherrima]